MAVCLGHCPLSSWQYLGMSCQITRACWHLSLPITCMQCQVILSCTLKQGAGLRWHGPRTIECHYYLDAAETASEPGTFEIPDIFIGDAFVEPFSLPPERRRSRGMLHRSARIRDDLGAHVGTRLVR